MKKAAVTTLAVIIPTILLTVVLCMLIDAGVPSWYRVGCDKNTRTVVFLGSLLVVFSARYFIRRWKHR